MKGVVPPAVTVLVDEAYIELAPDMAEQSMADRVRAGDNVIVARTFSKVFGMAGLRIGYGVAPEPCVALLNRVRQPFNVNSVALAAATAAFGGNAGDALRAACARLVDTPRREALLRLGHQTLDAARGLHDGRGIEARLRALRGIHGDEPLAEREDGDDEQRAQRRARQARPGHAVQLRLHGRHDRRQLREPRHQPRRRDLRHQLRQQRAEAAEPLPLHRRGRGVARRRRAPHPPHPARRAHAAARLSGEPPAAPRPRADVRPLRARAPAPGRDRAP